jgi:hypothetical protein
MPSKQTDIWREKTRREASVMEAYSGVYIDSLMEGYKGVYLTIYGGMKSRIHPVLWRGKDTSI